MTISTSARLPVSLLVGQLPVLTPAEVRVLEVLASGLLTREIADLLGVSSKAIEYHLRNLLLKLQARNRASLIAKAYTLGFIDTEQWPPLAVRLPAPRTSAL